jgi:hypothetical protein
VRTVDWLKLGTFLFLVIGAAVCWLVLWLWDRRDRRDDDE